MESFYIGKLHQSSAGAEAVQYKDDAAKGQFYDILRRRVEKFFRGNEVDYLLPLPATIWNADPAGAVPCPFLPVYTALPL